MENPGHAQEDEFFRAGTEGTYDGGPQSLAPVKLEDWATPAPDVATPAQLTRRRRLQRVVVGVVTTLGAVSLLGAALRLTSSPEASTAEVGSEPVSGDGPRDEREAPASTQASAEDTAPSRAAPPVDAPPATAATTVPAATSMSAATSNNDAASRTTPVAKSRESAGATMARAGASRVARISQPSAASYRRVLPSSYQPPTATFPN